MPLLPTHFAVGMIGGMIITSIAFLIKPDFVKKYFVWIPLFLTFCGFFANIPDFPEIFNLTNNNFLDSYFKAWPDKSPVYDLFFFHNWLDVHFKERFTLPGMQMVVIFYFLVFLADFLYFKKRRII